MKNRHLRIHIANIMNAIAEHHAIAIKREQFDRHPPYTAQQLKHMAFLKQDLVRALASLECPKCGTPVGESVEQACEGMREHEQKRVSDNG